MGQLPVSGPGGWWGQSAGSEAAIPTALCTPQQVPTRALGQERTLGFPSQLCHHLLRDPGQVTCPSALLSTSVDRGEQQATVGSG